jgi:2-keto-4-pentenoate hydratase
MTPDQLQRMAQVMLADHDARTPGQLFAQPLHWTILEAYALQGQVARLREERGEKVIGYKVGCTSKAIQEQLGIAQPIFGRLFDSECFPSGVRLSYAAYANLAIEGELAVRLSEDLPGSPLTDNEYLKAIETVFPVVELHHYVLRSARPWVVELIANNGMHAGVVLADKETRCSGLSKATRGLSIRINEVVVEAVRDAESLTSPIGSLRWLAERLTRLGLRLFKGHLILTGSPLKLYPVAAGSKIVVEAPPLGKSWAQIGP